MADTYNLGYLPTGRKAHLFYGSMAGSAVCGIFSPNVWLGTGSQAEYERAKALPPCRRCANLVAAGHI